MWASSFIVVHEKMKDWANRGRTSKMNLRDKGWRQLNPTPPQTNQTYSQSSSALIGNAIQFPSLRARFDKSDKVATIQIRPVLTSSFHHWLHSFLYLSPLFIMFPRLTQTCEGATLHAPCLAIEMWLIHNCVERVLVSLPIDYDLFHTYGQ